MPITEPNGAIAATPRVHRELKRKHITLVIVWDEYIAANPGGYSYSRFCELYRGLESKLSPAMRQTHAAGERLFVDYAGDGVPVVIDRLTGEIRKAQIFVAVLGAIELRFCARELDAGALSLAEVNADQLLEYKSACRRGFGPTAPALLGCAAVVRS